MAIDERTKKDMEAYGKRVKAVLGVISQIEDADTLDGLKAGVTSFLRFWDANPKARNQLCAGLMETVVLASSLYLRPRPDQGKNVVFVPPDAAPVVMIPTCVPLAGSEDAVYDGLNRLLMKIGEFAGPMEDAATEEEMNAVLDNAQRKFKALDIIAPSKPLMVVSLNNSHCRHNCECGIGDSAASPEAVILVYHPRDVSRCDRVFIFAHEIGHALHLALTGSIKDIPVGFDEFNDALDIQWHTLQEKQEAFADVTAFALLNGGGLNKHLPHRFSDTMLEYYDRYIGHITSKHLNP